jgi:hypothetical protein
MKGTKQICKNSTPCGIAAFDWRKKFQICIRSYVVGQLSMPSQHTDEGSIMDVDNRLPPTFRPGQAKPLMRIG